MVFFILLAVRPTREVFTLVQAARQTLRVLDLTDCPRRALADAMIHPRDSLSVSVL